MAATQVIEDDHLVPCLQQFPGNHAADITRSPGNQNPHWLLALSSQAGSGEDVNPRFSAARAFVAFWHPPLPRTRGSRHFPLQSIDAVFENWISLIHAARAR